MELQAILVERLDGWGRSLVQVGTRQKQITVPGPLTIMRPEEARRRALEEAKPKVDASKVAAFFGRMSTK